MEPTPRVTPYAHSTRDNRDIQWLFLTGNGMCVHGACTWCACVRRVQNEVRVHGVCTSSVQHGVCTMKRVHGVCTWSVYMEYLHGVCVSSVQ